MSALLISGNGIDIKGPAIKSNSSMTIPKVIGLTLSNRVIEDMIQCIQGGNSVQLSLDESPAILYGNKKQHFEMTNETSRHEIVRTTVPNLVRPLSKATIPHLPPNAFANTKMSSVIAATVGQRLSSVKAPVVSSIAEGNLLSSTKEKQDNTEDAAVLALQNSLASESLRKAENTVKYVMDGSLALPNKRGTGKISKTIISRPQSRANKDYAAKSLPLSPLANSATVPLSQKQAEHAKAARKPVIHLLAVSPMSERALEAEIPDSTSEDLRQTLEKVGDLNETTKKWELRKAFYKELDVWCFKYNCQEDRQRAIDNAVKIFDKMRMNVSEPQWEKLLPRSERGTGKCLSKLQAQIAQASSQKIPKSTDLGRDSPKNSNKDDLTGEKLTGKVKGETMVRIASQGAATKSKKVLKEREAQAKRLLSKKPPNAKTLKTKVAALKRVQSVGKDAKSSTNTLSSEYVESSDEEDDQASKPTLSKAQKRPRDNDDSSQLEQSMSPAKKVKETILVHNRSSDSSRTTSAGQYSYSTKSIKSNSPHKSSPLASSPPTNASDLEDSSGSRSPATASPHPRLGPTSKSPITKVRNSKSSTERGATVTSARRLRPEVTDLARKYKMYYPKYLELHEQLTGMGDRRDRRLERDLLEMHARLFNMKQEILAGIVNVSDFD